MVPVRRKCYPQSSPAGKGARWECAGSDSSQDWHPFDMDIQCLIEEAWARVCTLLFYSFFVCFIFIVIYRVMNCWT